MRVTLVWVGVAVFPRAATPTSLASQIRRNSLLHFLALLVFLPCRDNISSLKPVPSLLSSLVGARGVKKTVS